MQMWTYFLKFAIHDLGSLNKTDVPLNLSWPTAMRKSASGSWSLLELPNNLNKHK